jgi:hypothetical protein
MLVKQDVIKSFSEMPNEFSIDDAIDILIVINKMQKAELEIKEGKGFSTTEAKERLKNG